MYDGPFMRDKKTHRLVDVADARLRAEEECRRVDRLAEVERLAEPVEVWLEKNTVGPSKDGVRVKYKRW